MVSIASWLTLGSGLGAVALFVFLAGAAGAGVVAAYVAGGAALGGDGRASGVAGRGEVALLGAGEFAFELVDGGSGRRHGDGRG